MYNYCPYYCENILLPKGISLTRTPYSFAFQIEHEPEGGKLSSAFEAAHLFLVLRDKIWCLESWHWYRKTGRISSTVNIYATQRRQRKMHVLAHAMFQSRREFWEYHHPGQEQHVHPATFQGPWLLSCQLSCPFSPNFINKVDWR